MLSPFGRVVTLAIALLALAPLPGVAQPFELTGRLLVSWGDPPPHSEAPVRLDFELVLDEGESLALDLSPALVALAGGPARLNGQRVVVTPAPVEAGTVSEVSGPIAVGGLRLAQDAAAERSAAERSVVGSKPWVSILCKFADDPSEPEDLSFFQDMYGGSPGGLDHYWRELSYDAIDVAGSIAIDWVTLPSPRATYVPPGGSIQLTLLFNDCTGAADPYVDFSNGGGGFEGINMMFNDVLDCCAWGGTRWATLDGVTKIWRTTWEPPWAWDDQGVIGHEMGHGFGLPHSNNWDGDSNPYDSPWDVMSSATGYAVLDATYGWRGKHTIAYHKDLLGWIPTGQRFEPPGPGVYPLTLDHLALASTANLRMIRVPFGAQGKSYVIEVREQQGEYDGMLPGNAVLVFEIDPYRTEPAWLVDADDPPAGYASNEGSMWKVGETFEDLVNEVRLSVDSTAPEGFNVTLYYGTAPVLETSPATVDFGDVPLTESAQTTVTLENNSSGPETAVVVSMVLSHPTSFSLDPAGGASPCGSTAPTLASGASCTVELTFAPQSEAAYGEQLTIHSNAEDPVLALALSGTGIACSLPEQVNLAGTESSAVTEAACLTLIAGPYVVEAPGQVTLRAPTVVLTDGLIVDVGAELTIENPL